MWINIICSPYLYFVRSRERIAAVAAKSLSSHQLWSYLAGVGRGDGEGHTFLVHVIIRI